MGNWETDWNRDVLERIVALLFSLAGLADLAAGAPLLRRRRVLEILGRGEAEAWAFLIGTPASAPVQAVAPESASDAARLAARFRALALLLIAMLARPSALPGAAGPQACLPSHRTFGPSARRLDASAPPAPDTS